jgi:hypothetical protein
LKPKLLVTVLALAVCGAVALTGIAVAREAAETKVTIREQNGDFHGSVQSSKLNRCADERKVKVYKQQGQEQNPGSEEVVASDTSELQGDKGVWNTGNTGFQSGKYYARAGKIPGCKADSSKTVQV